MATTTQPSNAPQAGAPAPTEELTAARVLTDDAAGQPDAQDAPMGGLGAAAVPAGLGKPQAEAEARHLATGDGEHGISGG